jgi:LuxR family maltose regulon positive regulatory protein
VRKQASVQISPVALPLLYVLAPEARPSWDKYPPAGCFGDQLLLARALVDLRERGSLAGVRLLNAAARLSMTACLPPPWSAELAAAMVAAGVGDGRATLAALGQPARAVLADRIATSVSPIAGTARALLRELPSAPPYRLTLSTLGPVALHRDGVPVAAPALRRERVRQLLAYLLIHERPSRSAVTAALWPDLDESAAGRNLRVTLAYLQGVLEPDRGELDPPYFLRSSGGTMHLIVDESLAVDAVRFETCLAAAEQLERNGAPSAALASYQEATDSYHGDFFADLPDVEWLAPERDRLRLRFVESAVRAGNLVLARGDADRARRLAERAIAADGWSETGYQLLIAAHLAHGDRVSAHRTLRRCHQMLHELGVAAQQRTLALARQLEAGG